MTDDNKKQNDTSMDTEEKKDVVSKEEITTTEKTPEKKEVEENKKEEEKKEVVSEKKEESKDEKKDSTEKPKFARKPFKKNFKRRKPFKREKPEFDQKILSLRRVTRVMAGGRRFSFSVAMVVGDRKGRVGFGMGKSNDTVAAIEKAVRKAKKNMVKLKLTKTNSIPFDMQAKYKSSEIEIRPVKGKGLAAGGAVRTVLEFAGVKEGGAKILSRSKNHINNVKATMKALEPISEKAIVKKTFNKKKSFLSLIHI